MPTITIATFNVENLFGRYKVFGFMPADEYKKNVISLSDLRKKGGFLPGEMYAPKNSFEIFKDEWRVVTAEALRGSPDYTEDYPDIACLQEVESMRVLRLFNREKKYLNGFYPYVLLLDSHDPRLIDVGVLSRYKITDIKTHMDEPYEDKSGYLFSRDCLEVSFDISGVPLTLFVNHLKSKIAQGDKDKANKKRKAQATRVAEIVRDRFSGDSFSNSAFAVVGDFNDTPDSEYVEPVVKELGLENVVERKQDVQERWTYWWGDKNIVSQIDYILLSPRLSNDSPKEPYIERRGISSEKKYSYLAEPGDKKGVKIEFTFDRFKEVTDKVDASDHCPVFMELKL